MLDKDFEFLIPWYFFIFRRILLNRIKTLLLLFFTDVGIFILSYLNLNLITD